MHRRWHGYRHRDRARLKRLALASVIAIAAIAALVLGMRRSQRSRDTVAAAGSSSPATAAVSSEAPVAVRDAGAAHHVDRVAREQLRARILAGNHQLAAPAFAPPGPAAAPSDAAWRPLELTPEAAAYRDKTFAAAEAILDDCNAKTHDGGNAIKVEYIVIADDEAGGMFEDVVLPPDGNTSGPEMLECITNAMLEATLPAPPSDIERIHFSVEQIIRMFDAGT